MTRMARCEMNRDANSGLGQLEEARSSANPGACVEACFAPDKQLSASLAKASRVALLTGGTDKPYALGLASSLISHGVGLDFIGSSEVTGRELQPDPQVRFFSLRGGQRPDAGWARKVWRALLYYVRLIRYASSTEARVLHILWNNKPEILDRTLLLLYYRLLGKRIVFTAHNVNARRRDGGDTSLNRLTLRVQYHLVDHIFVHTAQMKRELQADFDVPDGKITVVPFGLNSQIPTTALTSVEARQRLGLSDCHKVVLFFGNIAPYKGLEYLVEAMALLAETQPECRLIIAGRPKNSTAYWEQVAGRISDVGLTSRVIRRIEHVPDGDTEIYFKAADVLVLPYTHVYQSGVLFLGYNFGLPVIASDVGSLKEEIIEGRNGFVCKPRDPVDLARRMETYFTSDLYRHLEMCRPEIRNSASKRHCWTQVGEITTGVYTKLVGRK